jgi:protein MpaA
MFHFGCAAPVTMIIAGIHGNEPTGTYVAEHLVKLLADSKSEFGAGSVVIVPRANPDGLAAVHRTNAHGVDLNRNFPATNWASTHPGSTFGGPAPVSEPETAALIDIILALKPRLIISIHSITGGLECNNYDGPAREDAEIMSRCNGYPVKSMIGYPTPGSLGSWAGIDRHMRVLTLELPRDLPAESAWAANRQALLSVLPLKPSTHRATSQHKHAPLTTTSRAAVDGARGDNQ